MLFCLFFPNSFTSVTQEAEPCLPESFLISNWLSKLFIMLCISLYERLHGLIDFVDISPWYWVKSIFTYLFRCSNSRSSSTFQSILPLLFVKRFHVSSWEREGGSKIFIWASRCKVWYEYFVLESSLKYINKYLYIRVILVPSPCFLASMKFLAR